MSTIVDDAITAGDSPYTEKRVDNHIIYVCSQTNTHTHTHIHKYKVTSIPTCCGSWMSSRSRSHVPLCHDPCLGCQQSSVRQWLHVVATEHLHLKHIAGPEH